jgi:hypothetical protein
MLSRYFATTEADCRIQASLSKKMKLRTFKLQLQSARNKFNIEQVLTQLYIRGILCCRNTEDRYVHIDFETLMASLKPITTEYINE